MTIAKTLIAATALSVGLLGAVSSSRADTTFSSSSFTLGTYTLLKTTQVLPLSIGDYVLQWTITATGLASDLTWSASLKSSTTGTTNLLDTSSSGSIVSGTSTSTYSQLIHVLTAGNYTFDLRANSKSTTGTIALTGSYGAAPLPSPGPIAGAGLPLLLGLAGWGWMRRRTAA